MMKVARIIVALLLVLTWTAAASAQGWRGLLPMRSTCQDVERMLGGAACGREQATYDLPGESVWFNFSVDGCGGGLMSERYEVPTGTVTGISISMRPGKTVTLSDLKVDLTKFEMTDISDMIGVYKYISREVGMYITALEDGVVANYNYVPPSSYDNLRCQPMPDPTASENREGLATPVLVGSFDPASPDQESRILGEAIRRLKGDSGRKGGSKGPDGLVLVWTYAGKGESLQGARLTAIRVRDRLVSDYQIAPGQVVTKGGGYRPRAEVIIYIQTPLPPSARPSRRPEK